MNMTDTLKGSYFAEVFPKGWDIEKIADCVSQPPESVTQPQPFWNPAFRPVACENLEEFGAYMGHEIAMQIRKTKEEGRKLILILPVGPMGMYKWAVYFLKEWNVDCKHVYGFNMDEWSDAEGNTLPASDPAAFQNAMVNAFYGPLGELTVPEDQRNFATKENLPTYAEKIAALKETEEKPSEDIVFEVNVDDLPTEPTEEAPVTAEKTAPAEEAPEAPATEEDVEELKFED